MLKRLIPDSFIIILIAVIAFAAFFPAKGIMLDRVGMLSNGAIFILFFFHGLRLSHAAIWSGLKQWRLQLVIIGFSFGVIPLAGVALAATLAFALPPLLWTGVLFLCALPSTVQSAIAYSSIGGGNVAASLIAAAVSNLLGVVLTPLIVAVMLKVSGADVGLSAIVKIATLLLLPFILGQVMQRWLSAWAQRHKVWISRMDKLTIGLAVYAAFSAAAGLWASVSLLQLLSLSLIVALLLLFAMIASWVLGGQLGFSREDRITLLFSGSHKTLATGAPMARILFPGAEAGLIIIPLMLYHQAQLIVSAWLAAKLARAT